jgi:hypothetical protein
MKPLTRSDLRDHRQYELVREAERARIIQLKAARRVHVGNLVTFVFENRDTLLFQVQEMVRVERIDRPDAVQAELDTYNALMPAGADLSATCFLEITDQTGIEAVLRQFVGLDQAGAVKLRLGGGRVISAWFEPGRSEAERISAVHYVRFRFTPADIAWWRSGEGEALLEIDLPQYAHMTRLTPAQRTALGGDFA